MRIAINMNDTVEFTLNEYGAIVLNEYYTQNNIQKGMVAAEIDARWPYQSICTYLDERIIK